MDTRREFVKKAALLTGGAGVFSALPASIQKAFAINPKEGSTYLDAEHVVFLMQENRSFDHCYGRLQGVRGFNNPRTVKLPNKNKVWLQTNKEGQTYAPFRLDLKDSKITWLGSLPHSWNSMTDARNEGKHDNWLEAKASGRAECKGMPLTMGYFDRQDIPFYYALADSFTVFDQHFCSSLTGTTPNRLHFWTGGIRENHDPNKIANVFNSDVTYSKEASWKTFPEVLEENDISWRIYQNEISLETGLTREEENWLSNFTNNPIEWFTQYHVRLSHGHINYLEKLNRELPLVLEVTEDELDALSANDPKREDKQKELKELQDLYAKIKKDYAVYNKAAYEKLSKLHKNLHDKAFSDNRNDPDYRSITTIDYDDDGIKRTMSVPKSDVLHQFRKDVDNDALPTVSYVVAPREFSDHPGAPWYGAWYLSEVIEILIKNPEVWKKTIFILNYDENDGYFDHIPPFVPPNPYKENSGKLSEGLDAKPEYVHRSQQWMKDKEPNKNDREGPIGLGFRVPMVVASPWTRGGYVNSEVTDLTSPIRFLEHFLSHKTGKKIHCENISAWRRAICGDITSAFRPYNGEQMVPPEPVDKIPFYHSIHKAQFKGLPDGFKLLSNEQIAEVNAKEKSEHVPRQEPGIRPANALPYEIYTDGRYMPETKSFKVQLKAGNQFFGKKSAAVPFYIYDHLASEAPRNYAVLPGDALTDSWNVDANGNYDIEVFGPNGFVRSFKGNQLVNPVDVELFYPTGLDGKPSGNISLRVKNNTTKKVNVLVNDQSYGTANIKATVKKNAVTVIPVILNETQGYWYDVQVAVEGFEGFVQRFSGRVETGKDSITDPYMGGL